MQAETDTQGGWSYIYQLLPYIEQGALYDRAKFVQANYPGNHGALYDDTTVSDPDARYVGRAVVGIFYCPSDNNWKSRFENDVQALNYKTCDGDFSFWWTTPPSEDSKGRGALTYRGYSGMESVTDGTSNTILYSERVVGPRSGSRKIKEAIAISTAVPTASSTSFVNANVAECVALRGSKGDYLSGTDMVNTNVPGNWWTSGWTMNSHFNTLAPPNAPGCVDHDNQAVGTILPPTSYHSGGVNGAFVDGSVRFISDTVSNISTGIALADARPRFEGASDFGVWGAMGTRAGGEGASP